jgi:gluconolactonase
MPMHRIRRHKDGRTTTVWEQPGCGPTSIKSDARGGFWILCHLAHRVLRVDGDFRGLRKVLEADAAGRRLAWPNDATTDKRGHLYFTSAGLFDLRAPAEGAVYFVDSSDRVQRIAAGLRYANGIRLDEGRSRLFVSEHLRRRVLVADVARPGEIGPLRPFFDLDVPALARPDYPLAGPDGLLIGSSGALYIAEYGAGRVLVVSAEGTMQRIIPVRMQFVTNFANWPERGLIAVTGAFSNDLPPMLGRVMALPR